MPQLSGLAQDFRSVLPVNNVSVEMEEQILGGIFLDPGILAQIGDLPVAAFSISSHRLIYNAILETSKAGLIPDGNTIAHQMLQAGTLAEAGGKRKLAQLLDRVLHSGYVVQHAQLLKNDYHRHSLSSRLRRIAELSEAGEDIGEVVVEATKALSTLSDSKIRSSGNAANSSLEEVAERTREILQLGYSELTENIELEKLRRDSKMSSSDFDRKIVRPIKRTLDGDRFQLELLHLLTIQDEVERIRQMSMLAPKYQMSAAKVEKAFQLVKIKNTTPTAKWYWLDDFLKLKTEGLQWIIPEFLPKGETVVLAGAPKSGKTTMAIDVAFCVSTGESTFLKETVKQGRVLIVSVDESESSTRSKMELRGLRCDDRSSVQIMVDFDVLQIQALEDRLKEFQPDLVVIDSLRRIVKEQGVNENSAEFADYIYTVKELLNRYNTSGIIVHHINKNPEALGVNKVRGSSAIAGAAWGMWLLDHVPKPDPNNKKSLIVDPSDPNRILSVFARDTEGQQLKLELDGEDHSWINHGPVGVSEAWEQEQTTLRNRIFGVLTRNSHKAGLTGREIIDLLGMTVEEGRSVYTVLNRMVNKRVLSAGPSPYNKRSRIFSLPSNDQTSDGENPLDNNGGSPKPGSPTPPPPPNDDFVESQAESYIQQDLSILNTNTQHLPNTRIALPSTQQDDDLHVAQDTQHLANYFHDNKDVESQSLDIESDTAILNTFTSEGRGGCVNDDWFSSDNLQATSDTILSVCDNVELLTEFKTVIPEPVFAQACKMLSGEKQQQVYRMLEMKDAIADDDSANKPFQVGDAVAHAEPYTAAYIFHGKVEEVDSDRVLVKWDERQGQANQREWYSVGELRRIESKTILSDKACDRGYSDSFREAYSLLYAIIRRFAKE